MTSAPTVAASRTVLWKRWFFSITVTAVWAVAVLGSGLGPRVAGHWESAVTMAFGSFLAGSSPEGGGAVAFPVFTKALDIPASVARTFGLSIQAVGMTSAVVSILMFGRPYHRRAAVIASVAAIVGFVASVVLFGRPDELFWPSSIPGPWVKATFSIVLATTSVLMLRHLRHGDHDHGEPLWNTRVEIGLVITALLGGFLSSMTGTGANIVVFLFLVALVDVPAKVALPSAIMAMAAVSVVGLVMLGVLDGQLSVEVVGDRVVAVGGEATDLAVSQADLLGLWLAAVPVVTWGAPLGSWVASRINEVMLVRFVALLAAIEVVTTVILVPELRTEAALMAYLVLGLVGLPAVFIMIRRHRQLVWGTAESVL
ncbi:MAG: TSUP family transporter [Actinomycetota bacterium]